MKTHAAVDERRPGRPQPLLVEEHARVTRQTRAAASGCPSASASPYENELRWITKELQRRAAKLRPEPFRPLEPYRKPFFAFRSSIWKDVRVSTPGPALPHPRSTEETSERSATERRSKLIFGNFMFLAVAVAIARSTDGMVNATDLSSELSVANSRVRSQLVALSEAGLLVAEPPTTGKRWYLRQESPFWACCLWLNEAWSR
jgi:hypothetical protein